MIPHLTGGLSAVISLMTTCPEDGHTLINYKVWQKLDKKPLWCFIFRVIVLGIPSPSPSPSPSCDTETGASWQCPGQLSQGSGTIGDKINNVGVCTLVCKAGHTPNHGACSNIIIYLYTTL